MEILDEQGGRGQCGKELFFVRLCLKYSIPTTKTTFVSSLKAWCSPCSQLWTLLLFSMPVRAETNDAKAAIGYILEEWDTVHFVNSNLDLQAKFNQGLVLYEHDGKSVQFVVLECLQTDKWNFWRFYQVHNKMIHPHLFRDVACDMKAKGGTFSDQRSYLPSQKTARRRNWTWIQLVQ